jgi:hypothetical protein
MNREIKDGGQAPKNNKGVMKVVVTAENFESKICINIVSSDWDSLEDRVNEIEEELNYRLPLFERYKIVDTKYYDRDGDPFDIYLREKITKKNK